jgi:hypothetical protein
LGVGVVVVGVVVDGGVGDACGGVVLGSVSVSVFVSWLLVFADGASFADCGSARSASSPVVVEGEIGISCGSSGATVGGVFGRFLDADVKKLSFVCLNWRGALELPVSAGRFPDMISIPSVTLTLKVEGWRFLVLYVRRSRCSIFSQMLFICFESLVSSSE